MSYRHLSSYGQVSAPRYLLPEPPGLARQHRADILVIGGGVAGLTAALQAARSAQVILLTHAPLTESNSARAQGGVAAALDDGDAPALHVEDTLTAGADLCEQPAVEALAQEAPALIRELADLGVPFERTGADFALGLEGGHSRRRIVHSGDATGWALTSALATHARSHPRIAIFEGYHAIDLLSASGRCGGALALDRRGQWHRFNAGATVLATGGAGALYGLTSNHPGALGEGIALAYRAGAEIADMEFVQFHPTVLRTGAGQGFLISEAARGEGARLLTPSGRRFMPEYDPRAELAPRDVVARAIFTVMRQEGVDHVLLDLTHLSAACLERRFPTICTRCRAEGIDPARDPIPVAPAAHYLMGGVRTDLHGATTLAGLYAAGECTCTGVHGANRLASNSLLECLVFGRRAGASALGYAARHEPAGGGMQPIDEQAGERRSAAFGCRSQPAWRDRLADLMRRHVGLLRSADGLATAQRLLAALPAQLSDPTCEMISAANAALAARLIATGALLRAESRGAHFRVDHPYADDTWRVHVVLARGRPARLVELSDCGLDKVTGYRLQVTG
jgi:L-aspartate oxidase